MAIVIIIAAIIATLLPLQLLSSGFVIVVVVLMPWHHGRIMLLSDYITLVVIGGNSGMCVCVCCGVSCGHLPMNIYTHATYGHCNNNNTICWRV